jgi:hypothetical protein
MSSYVIRNLLLSLNYLFICLFYSAPLLVLHSAIFGVVLVCLLIGCPDISVNVHDRIPISTIASSVKAEGLKKWQAQWERAMASHLASW